MVVDGDIALIVQLRRGLLLLLRAALRGVALVAKVVVAGANSTTIATPAVATVVLIVIVPEIAIPTPVLVIIVVLIGKLTLLLLVLLLLLLLWRWCNATVILLIVIIAAVSVFCIVAVSVVRLFSYRENCKFDQTSFDFDCDLSRLAPGQIVCCVGIDCSASRNVAHDDPRLDSCDACCCYCDGYCCRCHGAAVARPNAASGDAGVGAVVEAVAPAGGSPSVSARECHRPVIRRCLRRLISTLTLV